MFPTRGGVLTALALVAGLSAAACGLYDDIGGGGGGSAVHVNGTIASVNVDDPTRDLIIYIYTDICDTPDADPVLCADLQLPEDIPSFAETDYFSLVSRRIPGGNTSFRVKNAMKGSLTIVFLQDDADNPDRTVDPEDITITRDGQGAIVPDAANAVAIVADYPELQEQSGGSLDIDDIAIDFPAAHADGPFVSTTSTTGTTTPSSVVTTLTTSTTVTTSTLPAG